MISLFVRLGGVFLGLYLLLCAVLFFKQRSLVFLPEGDVPPDAASYFTLPVDGAQLIVSTRQLAGQKALIYFGGNAEQVALSLAEYAAAFPQHAIYLMHYRAYGGSSGAPSEAALQADALALFDLVQARHQQVTVVGRSLGSGIAIRLAAARKLERLVLVTPYDSILRVAQQNYPYVPVSLLLLDKFESWRVAPQIRVPTLILAAEQDEVIPRPHTDALFAAFAPGVARMQVLPATSHNTIAASGGYFAAMQ